MPEVAFYYYYFYKRFKSGWQTTARGPHAARHDFLSGPRKLQKNYSLLSSLFGRHVSGVRSGHASHALHDQDFRDCMTNVCAMRHIFFN